MNPQLRKTSTELLEMMDNFKFQLQNRKSEIVEDFYLNKNIICLTSSIMTYEYDELTIKMEEGILEMANEVKHEDVVHRTYLPEYFNNFIIPIEQKLPVFLAVVTYYLNQIQNMVEI